MGHPVVPYKPILKVSYHGSDGKLVKSAQALEASWQYLSPSLWGTEVVLQYSAINIQNVCAASLSELQTLRGLMAYHSQVPLGTAGLKIQFSL